MLHRLLDGSRFGINDDFTGGGNTFVWTATNPDAGDFLVGTGQNGYALIYPSDGTVADNDEIYVASAAVFLYKAKRPLYASQRYAYVEADLNKANVIFGFASGVGENLLIDNGGGVRQSGFTCCFYKVDLDNYWRVQTRDYYGVKDSVTREVAGQTTRTETIDGVVTSITPWQTLEIFIDDPAPPYQVSDRVLVATFRIDGRPLCDTGGNPIRHELSVLNATEMSLVFGVKNGSANNEGFQADWIHADQVRD